MEEESANEAVAVDLSAKEEVKYEDIAFDPYFTDAKGEVSANEWSMAAPIPCTLTWQDLKFSVETKSGCIKKQKKSKEILHGIAGAARPTELLAIMGSSGAGKTTLLNMLAGRLTSSKNAQTSGSVLLNGNKRDFGTFKRLSAYVEQDDCMFAEISVYEQIMLSAQLRLPRTLSSERKTQRVDKIIAELGLMDVVDTYVGSPIVRGISGGQRKRVNIGTELVTDPSIIFLDEPTSGLDAFNALNVMKSLRKLARRGPTVITTIHQPRSNIFSLFDKLLLLSEGRVMYFGPAAEAVNYFSALRFDCPPQFNPADFFIDLLSVDQRTPENLERSRKRIEYLGDIAEEQQEKLIQQTTLEQETQSEGLPKDFKKYSSTYTREISLLCGRQFKAMIRERAANRTRAMQILVFSILLGLIWMGQGRDLENNPPTLAGLQAISGVVIFLSINQSIGGVFSVIFVYPNEKAVVMRERASASYRVSSYLLSKTLVELPRTIAFVTVFIVILYWMIFLRATARAFFLTMVSVYLMTLCAESLALFVSIITPNPQVATAVAPLFIILNILFAGFFLDESLVPVWLSWIQYISFIKYGFSSIMQVQYEGTALSGVVEARYGNVDMRVSYVILALMWVAYRLIAYLALRLNGPRYDRKL